MLNRRKRTSNGITVRAPLRDESLSKPTMALQESSTKSPLGTRVALLLAGCAWILCGWAPQAAGQGPDEEQVHGFSIPNTRGAHALMERARKHIDAERWNEAIRDLQELIDAHDTELVLVPLTGRRNTSVHKSAADWATEQLFRMPEEAAQLYRRRNETQAASALALARRENSRRAIIDLAQRWPLCESAVQGWWTLGDLELELGNLSEARYAWARALDHRLRRCGQDPAWRIRAEVASDWTGGIELLDEAGLSLQTGEVARATLAAATLAETHALAAADLGRGNPSGNLRLAGPGEGAERAPEPDASTWPRPFRIPSPHPFENGNFGNLFPVRVGDLVLISNSMQLFAVNAYSGTLKWASNKPAGWATLDAETKSQYFAGIAREDTIIAPGASKRIAVAALQVPVSDLTNESYHNITITTIIPDRRLYAFDMETGKELWNHHPPENWDGESGTFTDRMSVAGPPIVTASRVVVPVQRMYGRIEFYAACYDLVSGEPLWTTQLVSGQRELNMFARPEQEFAAPPVRIDGDRVVVLTQLGAVAVLDLFSGRILWETLYEQIPSPARPNFGAQPMHNSWRNSPPVVADGVVVVTPFDSRQLIGLDLETGETLWALSNGWIESLAGNTRLDVDVLLGADERTVYLGGWPSLALRASGGLSREAPRELAWRYPPGELSSGESGSSRALLIGDRVVIPTRGERIEVDRFGGARRQKPVPWKTGRSGNLLVGDGTLYTLTNQYLDGYFEWDVLLERGRRQYDDAEGDASSTLYLASLYSERGHTEREAGRTARAREWLRDAQDLLEPFLLVEEVDTRLSTEMHKVQRRLARVLLDLADGSGALRALHRARELAPTRAALQNTLIEEHEIVRGIDTEKQAELLDLLEDACRGRDLEAAQVEDPSTLLGWRFEPRLEDAEEDFSLYTLPVPLWATLERSEIAALDGAVLAEFTELHRLIEFWPDLALPGGSAEELATRRISDLIDEFGRGAYAPFERKAEALLAEAREERSRDLLSFVSELYPFSEAGRTANDQLVEWAVEEGDCETVARIALSELPDEWAPELATPREVELLLNLAAVMETGGNQGYPRALYQALSERAPRQRSTVPAHGGRTTAEILNDLPALVEASPVPEPNFDSGVRRAIDYGGRHEFLGEIPMLPGTSSASRVLLFAREEDDRGRRAKLVAFRSSPQESSTLEPLWEFRLQGGRRSPLWKNSVTFIPGAVIWSTNRSVYALDRETGESNWPRAWVARGGDVDAIRASTGLVFATVRVPGKYDALHAIDASSGAEVWEAPLDRMRYDRIPRCGADRVVLLPRRLKSQGLILDLFTGRRVAEFELPERISPRGLDACWIDDGLLIVPWFLSGRNTERNRILAVDLWDGSLAWNVNFDEMEGGRRELRTIVEYGGKTFLYLRPQLGAEKEGVRTILVQLHLRLGATARVGSFEFQDDHRPIGINQETRVVLSSPFLYLRSFGERHNQMLVEALELPYGAQRWAQRLQVSQDALFHQLMPMTATSTSTVAFAVSTRDPAQRFGTPTTSLVFMDRDNGTPRGTILLDSKLGSSNSVSLHGLGDTLILAGDDLLEVLR